MMQWSTRRFLATFVVTCLLVNWMIVEVAPWLVRFLDLPLCL